MVMSDKQEEILSAIDQLSDELIDLAKKIHGYNELGFEEYQSSKALVEFIKKHGFKVKSPVAGLETAFLASFGSGKPNLALLCEYDALPEIGHACGHNMIGVISIGAAIAQVLAGVLPEHEGTITLVGCPAEEKGNTKGIIVNSGIFDDIDAAMIIHPASMSTGFDIAYAIQSYKIEFFGKSTHAASSPEQGINALDAMVSFFQGVALTRQQLPEKTRLHGIITNGGQSFNTIPEYTSAELGIRALQLKEVKAISQQIKNLAEGAALMTGCSYKMTLKDEMPDVFTNVPLAGKLTECFEVVGEKTTMRTYDQGLGSTDVGEVTYAVPAIQGYVNITDDKDIPVHTRDFERASDSEYGYQAMVRSIKALALTSYKIFSNPDFFREVDSFYKENQPER